MAPVGAFDLDIVRLVDRIDASDISSDLLQLLCPLTGLSLLRWWPSCSGEVMLTLPIWCLLRVGLA